MDTDTEGATVSDQQSIEQSDAEQHARVAAYSAIVNHAIIDRTEIGDATVSTRWVSFANPRIETMILGGAYDGQGVARTYVDENDARNGHAAVVEALREGRVPDGAGGAVSNSARTPARTPEEILARITAAADEDWMGFRHEVLVAWLPYEHAKPYLQDDVSAENWAAIEAKTGDIETVARRYLDFAIEKIESHRGISANRSVAKLTEYAWLMGRDDVVSAMESEPYEQYGAPKVKAFALGMGWPWDETPELERMADGYSCRPGCEEGCGR